MNQLEEITKYIEARCQENERLTFGSTYRHGAWQEDLWILAELDRMRESSKSTEPDTEYIRKDALLEWAKQKQYESLTIVADDFWQEVIDKIESL